MPPINEQAANLLRHSAAVRKGVVRGLAVLLGIVLAFGLTLWILGS